jgi:hypothetical protein
MNVVFLGPSLPRERARELAPPGTHFLPPAGQGDIASLCRVKPPKMIGLVDGLFRKSLSVWHKEILFALAQGVRVLGASSMGALRAVECESWGAEPIGRVAEWIKAGRASDPDVAVAHAGAEHEFRSLSLPIVNVMATLDACPHIGPERCAEIVAVARGIFYAERHWPALAKKARCSLLERKAITAYQVDRKAIDAEELLSAMHEPAVPRERRAAENIFRGYGAVLQANDVRIPCSDRKIRRAFEIARANLWCIDQAANRQLAVECARMLGLEETARAEVAEMMGNAGYVRELRAKFDLLPSELERFLTDERLLAHGRAWAQGRDFSFGNAPRILNYLRAAAIYPQMKIRDLSTLP